MNPIAVLRRYLTNVERSRQMLEEIRAGVANLTDVTDRRLVELADKLEAVYRAPSPPEFVSRSSNHVGQRAPFPAATRGQSSDR